MNAHFRFAVLIALASPLLVLAGCNPAPQTQASRAARETLAACRARAEDVYVRQNRDLIYNNDTTSTPYSAGPNTGIPTHGLSSLFANEQVVDDCVRNTGTQAPRTDATTAIEPGSPAPSSAVPSARSGAAPGSASTP